MSRWISQPKRRCFQLVAHSPPSLISTLRSLHTKQATWNNSRLVWILSLAVLSLEFGRTSAGGWVRKRENENVLRWHLKVKSVEIYFRGTARETKKKREHLWLLFKVIVLISLARSKLLRTTKIKTTGDNSVNCRRPWSGIYFIKN